MRRMPWWKTACGVVAALVGGAIVGADPATRPLVGSRYDRDGGLRDWAAGSRWKAPAHVIPSGPRAPSELRHTSTTMTPPPTEPVRWTAEFEPMHGTLIAWPLRWTDAQDAFCAMVEELQDVGVVYMLYDHEREQAGIIEKLTACGVAFTNLVWVPYPHVPYSRIRDHSEGVFTRDYGPENIFGLNSGSWGVVDNRYFGFAKMDAVNATLNLTLQAEYFETPLIAEGGNLSPDGMGRVFSTEWILTENHVLGEEQTRQAFRDYYGAELVVLPRPPISEHLDMYAKLVGPEAWIVGAWPADDPNTPRVEEAVRILQGMHASTGNPYTIYRISQPARLSSGYWRTYTNAYQHNGKVLVPTYHVPEDAAALAVYQQALPGWEIIGIDARGFDHTGGALHCSTHEIARP
jgi:agmatine deiminase